MTDVELWLFPMGVPSHDGRAVEVATLDGGQHLPIFADVDDRHHECIGATSGVRAEVVDGVAWIVATGVVQARLELDADALPLPAAEMMPAHRHELCELVDGIFVLRGRLAGVYLLEPHAQLQWPGQRMVLS